MDFFKYRQEVEARVLNQINILDNKYWYLPRKLICAIYFAAYETGVNETTKINVKMAEMVENGADPNDLVADMEFVMLTDRM